MASRTKLRAEDLVRRYNLVPAEIAKLQELGLLQPGHDQIGAFFSRRDEARLQIALKGRQLGFTMREIAAMVAIVAGTSTAALMIHLSSLCRVCLKTGMPYADVFFQIII